MLFDVYLRDDESDLAGDDVIGSVNFVLDTSANRLYGLRLAELGYMR